MPLSMTMRGVGMVNACAVQQSAIGYNYKACGGVDIDAGGSLPTGCWARTASDGCGGYLV